MSVHFSFADALDRTVRFIAKSRAVRWSPARPPTDAQILDVLTSASPKLIVARDAVQEPAGRLLATAAMRVLVRTFPHAAAIVDGDPALQKELDALADEVWPIRGAPTEVESPPELVIGCCCRPSSAPRVFVGIDGWLSLVGVSPQSILSGTAAAGLTSASIGVGEITKAVFRRLLPEHGGRWTSNDLAAMTSIVLNSFDPGGREHISLPQALDLGEVLVVSAGALTNALLLVLQLEPVVSARLHILDGDHLDFSNLNRYVLVGWLAAAAGLPKATFFRSLSSHRLQISGDPVPYTRGTRPRPLVAVGADRLAARHDVQADGHDVVVNGASEPDLVRISTHRRDAGRACVGCENQGVDDVNAPIAPTISFVSSLAGALLAAQLQRVAMGCGVPGHVVDLHPLHPDREYNLTSRIARRAEGCPHCRAA